MGDEFDPYLRWLGIRTEERPPNHYALLGVHLFEYDPEVLANAADRQMAHVRTFQAGKHSAESQQLLNELASAKICLLDPERRAAYDAALRARREGVELPAVTVTDTPTPSVPGRSKRTNISSTVIVLLVAAAIAAIGVVAVAISRNPSSPEDPRSRWEHLPPKKNTPHGPPRKRTEVPRHKPRTVVEREQQPPEPSPPRRRAPRVVPEPSVEPEPVAPEPEPSVTEPMDEPPLPPEPRPVEVKPTPEPAKPSLPSLADRRVARKKIRQKHAARYQAIKKPDELRSLASALLREASDSNHDNAMLYVYFEEAATAATVGGGRGDMLHKIVSKASGKLDIPEDEILIAFLKHIAGESIPLACRKTTLETMAETAAKQANREKFDLSKEVLKLTLEVARRTNDTVATKQLSLMKKKLETREEAFEAAQRAEETLRQVRDDPEAHRICGIYDCFYKDHWSAGCKHLLRGDKPRLRKLAELDRDASDSDAKAVEVGDAWRAAVSLAEPALRDGYRRRAIYWYRRSLKDLSGHEKQKVENRIRLLERRLK